MLDMLQERSIDGLSSVFDLPKELVATQPHPYLQRVVDVYKIHQNTKEIEARI